MATTTPIPVTTTCATGEFLLGLTCHGGATAGNYMGIPYNGIILQIQPNPNNYVNVYSSQYTGSLDFIKAFGTPTTLSSLYGDAGIYRPGLLSRDLWKWDLSGESDYGLIEPPINEPNYDLFDSNWSAQFIVHSRGGSVSCKTLGLPKCSFDGSTIRGTTYNPYYNCTSKNYPKGPSTEASSESQEPTYLDLNELYKKTKECSIIKSVNKEYLGCIYNDPLNECSCDCPNQGASFADYLACSKTNATFWDTPLETPLHRNAQMGQLMSESIEITISGFLSNPLRLGQIITINNYDGLADSKPKKNSGKWLVSSITYNFIGDNHYSMDVLLNRDTLGDVYKSSGRGPSSSLFGRGNSDNGGINSGGNSNYWS